jgi:hypothetical protein
LTLVDFSPQTLSPKTFSRAQDFDLDLELTPSIVKYGATYHRADGSTVDASALEPPSYSSADGKAVITIGADGAYLRPRPFEHRAAA